jgi:hypothetical protein
LEDDTRLPSQALGWSPAGCRKRGRPRGIWDDDIKELRRKGEACLRKINKIAREKKLSERKI